MEGQNLKDLTALGTTKRSRARVTLDDFVDLFIVPLCASYPRTAVSAATIEEYRKHLSRYTIQQLTAALYDVVEESEFFPTIAEIKRAVAALPRPKPPLMLEERPNSEQVAIAQAKIREMIDGISRATGHGSPR